MSGCDDVRHDLGGYVLGGLDADEQARLDAHLAHCAHCQRELASLAPLPRLLAMSTIDTPAAPPDLHQRILANRPRRRSGSWRLIAAAIVLVVAVAGVVAIPLALTDDASQPDTVVAIGREDDAGIAGRAALHQTSNGVRVDLELAGARPAEDGYYHVWLHRGRYEVSAGTFVGSPDSEVRAQLLCGGQLVDYGRLTVTWHPFDDGDQALVADTDLTAL